MSDLSQNVVDALTILWSQSKQRNEVADAKPVVLTLKVKIF